MFTRSNLVNFLMTINEYIPLFLLPSEYRWLSKETSPFKTWLLESLMVETKKNGSVIGSERIAVMTALNIANEMLEHKKENQDYNFKIDSTLSRLQSKINDALDIKNQLDYG